MATMTREMTQARSYLANLHQLPHTEAEMHYARQRVDIARLKRDIQIAQLTDMHLSELVEFIKSLATRELVPTNLDLV